VRSSRCRHLITILTSTTSKDAEGAEIQTPTTFATWYAEMIPLRGTEVIQGAQLDATLTHLFRGRWVSGVTPKMTLSYADAVAGTRTFEIARVINVRELNRTLEILATEEV
jgi:head-tail adaptor